jgi:ketosteroid isomerase-like protein
VARNSAQASVIIRAMARDDEALVRRAYELWNNEGPRVLESFGADSVELVDPPQMPDSRAYRGYPAVLARLEEVAEAVGGRYAHIDEVSAVGDEVLVALTWRVDASPARAILGEVFHVVRVDNGKIARMRVFLTRDEALAAAST